LLLGAVLCHAQDRRHVPISIEDVIRAQTSGFKDKNSVDLNERLRSMTAVARFSQDYLLGPGDIILITVYGIEDLKQKELTLDSGGWATLPFIHEVQLIGLTPREAEVKIAALYEASVIKNPQVSVSVKDYRSQFINVLGAVFKPGTYQLMRRAFLIDALAMAGGLLAEKAESKAFVQRANPGEGQPNPIEVDLVDLLEKGNLALNVPVYAGDVISVPERADRYYYVLGDVNRGGAFEIKRSETITLTRALAAAGGLMPTAKTDKTVVIRQLEDGSTKQISVDVKLLLKGRGGDMRLGQNDVVFVPGSTTKTVGRGVLNSIGGVLAALVYVGIR